MLKSNWLQQLEQKPNRGAAILPSQKTARGSGDTLSTTCWSLFDRAFTQQLCSLVQQAEPGGVAAPSQQPAAAAARAGGGVSPCSNAHQVPDPPAPAAGRLPVV